MKVQSFLLTDIKLSLITQKNNLGIIDVVDAVEKKTKYSGLLKKLDEEESFIFTAFATFKKIVKKIEKDENESGAQMHQGEKIKCYIHKEKVFSWRCCSHH